MSAPDPRARVLIVDDDRIVASSIAELLAGDGFLTTTAGSAEGAIAAIEAAKAAPAGGKPPRPVAVVIVDMSMPGMSGLELIERTSAGLFPVPLPLPLPLPSWMQELRDW